MMSLKNFIRNNKLIYHFSSHIYSLLGMNRIKIIGKHNYLNFGTTFRKRCYIYIKGNNNIIRIDDSIYAIKGMHIAIYGSNNTINIGKNFATDGFRFSIEDDSNSIVIGRNCHGGQKSEFAAIEGTSINVGDDCMLSANITVRTGDSHSIIDNETGKRINQSRHVTIGNHVWIGNTVIILKGTIIQSNSVVAGGSVVPGKTYPPNSIIGGNPAKILKSNINWLSDRI